MAETFLYVTTTGRVTGNPHTIEIWYVEHEESYYFCAEFPEKSDTLKNIRKNERVLFYVGERGQDIAPQEGIATIAEDEVTLAILRQKFDSKYQWSENFGTFVGIAAE